MTAFPWAEIRPQLDQFFATLEHVVIDQRRLLERLLIALLSNGHVLLEGLPGLAKTLAIQTLANAVNLKFQRIQFTPDLLPADVLGTQIYNPRTGEFSVKQGPIFANFILADEINRAPAKVQSALLEAMQERQVTIGETTFPLPQPFFVLATQNPIDQEGTYTLPEAQIDRFMLKLIAQYPSKLSELAILQRLAQVDADTHVEPIWDATTLATMRGYVKQVHTHEAVERYIVDIVQATRPAQNADVDSVQGLIQTGASPRASISLWRAAKGHAFLAQREFITPDDVKQVAPDVLRHRIQPSFEAEAQDMTSEQLIKMVLDTVPVPQ